MKIINKIKKSILQNKKYYLYIFLFAAIDIISKSIIKEFLFENGPYKDITPFFRLIAVYNTGVGFSFLYKLNYITISIIVFTCTLILLYVLLEEKDKKIKIYLSMVIGGAFGNNIDRILHKAVFDFLDVYVKHYHWPTFNIADIFISVGIFFIVLSEIKSGIQKK